MLTLFPLIFTKKVLPEGEAPTAEKFSFNSQRGQAHTRGRTKTRGTVMQWGALPVALSQCLERGSSLPVPLLPREALGLPLAEPLEAFGFNLPGTAELFLTGIPIARTESF